VLGDVGYVEGSGSGGSSAPVIISAIVYLRGQLNALSIDPPRNASAPPGLAVPSNIPNDDDHRPAGHAKPYVVSGGGV